MDRDAPPSAPSAQEAAARLDPHLGEAPRDAATQAAQAASDPAAIRAVLERGARSPPLTRKAFFSDKIDRWLFVAFAILGVGVVAGLKLVLGIYALWTAAPPVAILIAYAWFVQAKPYFRLHPDRLGDNCYYMGFIFTLASLAFALIQLEQTTGTARASLLDTLIGNFGIALFSTIAGIALRVFFIQFRREVEDEEEQIRQDLQAVATRLKDQLSLAVLDLEGFRVRTGQVLEERLINAAEEFARIQQGMARTAGAAAEKFATFQNDLAGRAETVAAEMVRSARDLTASAGQIAGEMSRLIVRVERIETPPDLLVRHLQQAEGRISQVATALERFAEQDAKRAAAFEAATTALLKQLGAVTESATFSRLEAAAAQLEQRLAASVTGLTRYQQAVEGLSDGAAREKAALAAIRETLQQDARNSAEALRSLEATLADIARGIAARLG